MPLMKTTTQVGIPPRSSKHSNPFRYSGQGKQLGGRNAKFGQLLIKPVQVFKHNFQTLAIVLELLLVSNQVTESKNFCKSVGPLDAMGFFDFDFFFRFLWDLSNSVGLPSTAPGWVSFVMDLFLVCTNGTFL